MESHNLKLKRRSHSGPEPTLPGLTHDSSPGNAEARHLSAQQLATAHEEMQAVVDAVPPLLVLDARLRVKHANASFYKHFRVTASDTLGHFVYALGDGQWNSPKLRIFLEEILPRHSFFNDFEVTHAFETIGVRTVLLSGHQIGDRQEILLFIDDVTERIESRAILRASEIHYRRLFEAAKDGILILDPKTRKITDANPFITKLLGYTHAELLGKELWEIGLLADESDSRESFEELQADHFIRYENLPLQSKTGQHHEVEFVSNLYEEDGGSVIQCNIRDITDRKKMEKALRRNEERYRTLFNSIDEGFCVVEVLFDQNAQAIDYRFVELNPSFESQSGLHGATGKTMRELLPDCEAHWFEILGRVALTGKATRFVNEVKALKRWFDVYAFRLSGQDSPKVAILFRNITERREADQALLAAKNKITQHAAELEQVVAQRTLELRQKIGELEGFSYSVSHDMRAPLRAMHGYSQFLLDEYSSKLDAQGVNFLQEIKRSALRLDRLIQDVLSYTRILHSPLSMAPQNLDRLVRDVLETYPNNHPVKPEITINGPLPQVVGNEALLTQCVSNLLSNGVKFVAPGTKPRVEISAQAIGNSAVRVCFKDNGIGIAPENHERIFRLFERIHPDEAYEGTGIGLTIVRKASERMGAQVGFESEVGRGSNFWIQLAKG